MMKWDSRKMGNLFAFILICIIEQYNVFGIIQNNVEGTNGVINMHQKFNTSTAQHQQHWEYPRNRSIISSSSEHLLNIVRDANNVNDSPTQSPDTVECREVRKENTSEQCAFVNSTDDCQIDEGFIDYTIFLYCQFKPSLYGLALTILIFWWLFLFIALGVTADDYFCPNLVVMSKTMRLSDNIAGVTLMAFGNGAPDVFSAIAAVKNMKNGDAGLAAGALIGAGIFVTTVVAGSVAFAQPFESMQRPLLRDIIFYIGAVFFTFYVFYDNVITIGETTGFLSIYIVYVIVVVAGRYIFQRIKRLKNRARTEEETHINDRETQNSFGQQNQIHSDDNSEEIDDYKGLLGARQNVLGSSVQDHMYDDVLAQASVDSLRGTINDDDDDPLLNDMHDTSALGLFKDFLFAMSPIDTSSWSDNRWYGKIFEVFKAPGVLILNLSIPVVDRDQDKEKWNRPLRCINIAIGPFIALILFNHEAALQKISGVFPIWALVFLISCIIAVVVFVTSKEEEPPFYHPAFAFIGFLVAVIWISSIANEIVNILQTFGVTFNLSNALLGLTLLAWGNSIGDLVADVAVAKMGRPRIGISACFGGPLFNLLIGIGLPFLIKCISSKQSIQLDFTLTQVLLITTLFISLLSTLIIVPVRKFKFDRIYSAYLYTLYAVFLILVVLVEVNVITGDV